MTDDISRDRLIERLVKAGELLVSGAPEAEISGYFDVDNFRFHGPDGYQSDFAGLSAYFASLRDAFDDRSIKRGIILVDGKSVACQTWIEGTFAKAFTMSPAGVMPPNGARIRFDLINIFQFDHRARLVEEYVQTDNHSLLRRLSGPAT